MSKVAITAQDILHRGFLALKNGKLQWTEGEWGVKDDGGTVSDIIAYAEEGGNIKEIKEVCSIGLVDWVIASTPGLTKAQKNKLRKQAAELLAGSIYDWATASDDIKAAYKRYVEDVQQSVEKASERILGQFEELLVDYGYDRDALEKVSVDTLVTPLSFELWVDSDYGKEALYSDGILPYDVVYTDGDPIQQVIEFNDSGGNVDADAVQEIFKKASKRR